MIKTNAILDTNSAWIMYSAENSDPFFTKFITDKTIVPSACILSKQNTVLFVHELDKENIKNFNGQVVVYDSKNSISKSINQNLKQIGFPAKIYMNFSDR